MNPYDDRRPKQQQVEEMFDNIAPAYDRLNDIMSFGIARAWRRAAVRRVERSGARQILDLATGTADLAIAMARRIPEAEVTGGDISEGMLALGREKVAQAGLAERITLVAARAEELPFADGRFDAVTAAFGVRNFADIGKGLAEMSRVLESGGGVFILEFSTPRSKIFGSLYRFYFHRVLPRIGGMISKDRRAYAYLPGSVAEFPSPEGFLRMMEEAGFAGCRAKALTGGVAYIYTGTKRDPCVVGDRIA